MAAHKDIKALFYKFLSDQCTPEEIETIIDYLKNAESDKDLPGKDLPGVEEVKTRLQWLPKMDNQSADRIFQRVISTKELVIPSAARQHQQHRRQVAWRVAAAFVGLLLLAGIVYPLFVHNDTIQYATHFGEMKTIHLPDGSEVMLNANSRLRIPEDWDQHMVREVWLEGEAFFSIAHTQEDQKFLVHTSRALSIEVLGTQFNVNSRRNKTSIVLNCGKVKVKAQKKGGMAETVMQPGEMVEYEKKSQQLIQKAVDTELYTSWRKNLLMFNETSLEEVAQIIRDNYGYQVSFASDSLAQLRFTGSNPTDNLALLLKTLARSFDLSITLEGKQITVTKTKK